MGQAIIHGLRKQITVKIEAITATVNSEASVQRLDTEFGDGISVTKGGSVAAAQSANVVILACPPDVMASILSVSETRQALQEKPLISVLAGVTTKAMRQALGDGSWVFRALPNLAIAQCASATAIETPDDSIPKDTVDLVDRLFGSLGGLTYVPASNMDAATVMCGSTPAWVALYLDGMIDGAIAAGVSREKARSMASQMLSSTAALLQTQSPSSLRESICAMPGCTIQGNLILEEGCIRGTAARAVKKSIEAASKLG